MVDALVRLFRLLHLLSSPLLRIDGLDGTLPANEDAAAVPVSERYSSVTVDVDARSTDNAGYGVREQYYLQFKQLEAGDEHTCGILMSSSEVLCWGNDAFKQCSGAPKGVAFASISSGARNTCGITASDGRLLCWGDTSLTVPSHLASTGTVPSSSLCLQSPPWVHSFFAFLRGVLPFVLSHPPFSPFFLSLCV